MQSILFVDDEQEHLESYKQALRSDDYDVLEADNVEEAKELLEDIKSNGAVSDAPFPSVVVLDMMMSEYSFDTIMMKFDQGGPEAIRPGQEALAGVKLYEWMKQSHPDTTIIVFSILSESEIKSQAPGVKFDCKFLQKGRDHPVSVYKTIERELQQASGRRG